MTRARLGRTHVKPLGPTGLSTTIAEIWDPAAGNRVRLMGLNLKETAGTAVSVAVTNGTAAASGTIGYFSVAASGITGDVDFGDKGLYGDVDAEIGFKTLADAGTVVGTLVGREESF